jgi:hypothetical protein
MKRQRESAKADKRKKVAKKTYINREANYKVGLLCTTMTYYIFQVVLSTTLT